MAFDLDEKYILEVESFLSSELPASYKLAMKESNGGEVEKDGEFWELFPIADKSDRKRISRTYNNIITETKRCADWQGFPEFALAIASDGVGNNLVFLKDEKKPQFLDKVYAWDHETGAMEVFADSFGDLEII